MQLLAVPTFDPGLSEITIMFRQEELLFLVNKILLWGDSTGSVVADLFTDMDNPDIWCDFLSL